VALFRSKRVRNRAILIQALFVAGLIAFYKFGMPGIEKARARAAAEEREQAITAFFQSVTVEVGGSANPAVNGPASAAPVGAGEQAEGNSIASAAGGAEKAIPKRLRETPEVQEVEQQLGAPDQRMTGYGGAEHLTWVGTRHKLQASFNKGELYALTMFDLKTGHGETVYETSAYWRAF
jgi:hypothetical protein